MVALNIWYDVGSRDEKPGQTGWAHLFEHLMFQGSKQVASGEHLNLLQSVGGNANATTSFDRTNYFETVPVGALDLALWLEADRLATLADSLTAESVATQQEVVKEERRQRYDNVPYGDAIEHLLELTFPPGHEYSHSVIGSMADVDAANPKAAGKFFKKNYIPANAVISLVGDVDPDYAFSRVEYYFGGIESGPRRKRKHHRKLPPLQDHPYKELRASVPADCLQYVFRIPKRDTVEFDACTIGISVLADGPVSRLETLLVREKIEAAGVSGGVMDLIGGNSLALISLLAMPQVSLDSLAVQLNEQLERLADQGPTENELRRAKVRSQADWLAALATLETRADDFSEYATLFDDPDLVNTRINQIIAMTAEQVRAATAKYLLPQFSGQLRYLMDESAPTFPMGATEVPLTAMAAEVPE
jgi:predicted Zn-dependent peptidase